MGLRTYISRGFSDAYAYTLTQVSRNRIGSPHIVTETTTDLIRSYSSVCSVLPCPVLSVCLSVFLSVCVCLVLVLDLILDLILSWSCQHEQFRLVYLVSDVLCWLIVIRPLCSVRPVCLVCPGYLSVLSICLFGPAHLVYCSRDTLP